MPAFTGSLDFRPIKAHARRFDDDVEFLSSALAIRSAPKAHSMPSPNCSGRLAHRRRRPRPPAAGSDDVFAESRSPPGPRGRAPTSRRAVNRGQPHALSIAIYEAGTRCGCLTSNSARYWPDRLARKRGNSRFSWRTTLSSRQSGCPARCDITAALSEVSPTHSKGLCSCKPHNSAKPSRCSSSSSRLRPKIPIRSGFAINGDKREEHEPAFRAIAAPLTPARCARLPESRIAATKYREILLIFRKSPGDLDLRKRPQ